MSSLKRDSNQRSSNNIRDRIGRQTKVEYVNRAGERVNPHNGKPYSRTASTSSTAKENGKSRGKRPLPIKTSGAMFGGLERIPTDPSIDPPPRACFNCWQPGHSRLNCPRPRVARICNNCGRRGEDLRSCPRCSRAHQKFLDSFHARENGHHLESPLDDDFFPADEEDADNACDEVLRELIYADQQARERLKYEERERERRLKSQEQHIAMAMIAEERSTKEMRNNYDHYRPERNIVQYHEERNDRRRPYSPYRHEREDPQRSEERDVKPYPERDIDNFLHQRRQFKEERDIDEPVYRNSRSVSPPKSSRQVMPSVSGSSTAVPDDPVHDLLLLVKSIAHLTPETQDLIMRQVIAERKEKARMRSMRVKEEEEEEEDAWP